VQEAKAFQEMVDLDRAMVTIGKTPRQRRTILVDGGLSEAEANGVMKGINLEGSITTLLNLQSINQSLKNTKINYGSTEHARVLANARAAKAKLVKLGYKFKG
jgi:hypothetical protein